MSYQNRPMAINTAQSARRDWASAPLTRRQATMKRSSKTPTASDPCRTVSIPIGLRINERTDQQHINYLLRRLAALAWIKRMRE